MRDIFLIKLLCIYFYSLFSVFSVNHIIMQYSYKQITTFVYGTKDFNFVVKSCEENESSFDSVLQHMWKQAEESKAFRYILNIRDSKTLKGKYRFLAQVYSFIYIYI